MTLDRATACDILGIPRGANEADIKQAYKHLALKWHPDKHEHGKEEATQKFQDISAAYKYLTSREKINILNMDIYDLFAEMFFATRASFRTYHSSDFYHNCSDHEDDNWTSVDSSKRNFPKKPDSFSYTANRPSASEASKNAEELMKEEESQKKMREKRKSKKKRQREKKREEKVREEEVAVEAEEEQKRKEEFIQKAKDTADDAKRRAENKENIPKTANNSKLQGKAGVSSKGNSLHISNDFDPATPINERCSDSEDDIDWDQNCAFFAGATASIKKTTTGAASAAAAAAAPAAPSWANKAKKNKNAKSPSEETAESIDAMDPLVLKSRQTAVKGNEMANLGQYAAAIDLFTQAIQLDPRDFRFFGNRSFCYDRLKEYDNALTDANKAIALSKEWPKGYFRKGRALAGLKNYAEAERSFEYVLKLDKNCQDAIEELQKVRILRLMEMGFSRVQSDAAIRQYGSVQAALDALLTNGVDGVINPFSEDVYISDEEDYITQTIEHSKVDARNPLNVRSIWVGNLNSTVSEKQLRELFGQFGEIESLRRLSARFCAFINYKRPEEAARALNTLQGVEVGGQFLLIKFPDNPILEGQPRITVLKKASTMVRQPASQQVKGQQSSTTINNQTDMSGNKVTGPVNGNECYYWRTTGCTFGNHCKNRHLTSAKGVDRKPWQKVANE